MLSIVLIEPEIVENIGFIARVMKNFDVNDLILINPCKITEKAYFTAVHAKDIIKNAKIINNRPEKILKELKEKYDYLIGTTAKITDDFNLIRDVLQPSEFFKRISQKHKIALVLGRESIGMKNQELELCDVVLTIPTSEKYPTMNISHALAIMLYEYYKKTTLQNRIKRAFRTLPKHEKEILMKKIEKTLENMPIKEPSRKITMKLAWKRVLGKIDLTKREGYALMGYFQKINYYLNKKIKSQKKEK